MTDVGDGEQPAGVSGPPAVAVADPVSEIQERHARFSAREASVPAVERVSRTVERRKPSLPPRHEAVRHEGGEAARARVRAWDVLSSAPAVPALCPGLRS